MLVMPQSRQPLLSEIWQLPMENCHYLHRSNHRNLDWPRNKVSCAGLLPAHSFIIIIVVVVVVVVVVIAPCLLII